MENIYELTEKRKKIIQDYVGFFQRRGYHPKSPVDFITADTSVLFTNSTINPWKKYAYSEPISNQGIFVNHQQPCLRLHSLTEELTPQVSTERESKRLLGYFNMLGILCEKEMADSLPLDALNLLTNIYKVPMEDISIFVSNENDFINTLEGKVKIVRGTEKRGYTWKYGKNYELFGEGAKIRLLQRDGSFASIGQIIKVNSPHKTTFEFGFGVETFLSTLESRKDYSAWTIYHHLPEEYRFKTLLDLTSCFGTACTIDSNLLSRKHRKEIVRLARRIVRSEKIFEIPPGVLEDSINKFIKVEFNNNLVDSVSDKLKLARRLED